MSVQTALVAIKTANTVLNDLVGKRFRPDKLVQGGAFPQCRFQVISRRRHDYTFAKRATLATVRVQLDGYAETDELRAALRIALINCFTPATRINNASYGGETILDIRIDGEYEGEEMLDTNRQCSRITLDLLVDIVET